MQNMWATPFCERRSMDAAHAFSGVNSKGLLTRAGFWRRNLTEARSFPPLVPGRRLLNKHIPDGPAPGLTSEVPQTSSKTDCCSNLLSFFKSTLWGNVGMAETVGIVKNSGRLQRQEGNHSLSDDIVWKSTFIKWTRFQSKHLRHAIKMPQACVRIAVSKSLLPKEPSL